MSAELTDRRDQMAALRRSGATFQQIADRYGVSKQRVHEILAPLEVVPRRRLKHPRAKGRTFEAEVARRFREAGFEVRKLAHGGDLLCIAGGELALAVEAKRHEQARLTEWQRQLERDAPANVRRLVAWRRSRGKTYVMLELETYLEQVGPGRKA